MNKSYTIGVQCKCGDWVAVDIVPRVAADIKELAATDSQQLKPKMPDYLELLSTIDDSRFTIMDGKEHVRVGTRLMYDSLVRHFGR